MKMRHPISETKNLELKNQFLEVSKMHKKKHENHCFFEDIEQTPKMHEIGSIPQNPQINQEPQRPTHKPLPTHLKCTRIDQAAQPQNPQN